MPRIAWISRTEGRRCRRIIRIRAVAAVPLSPPPPYTRYTTCRSSTITIGSATAVLHLRPPEEDEPDDQGDDGPARPGQPQVRLADDCVAVGAVVLAGGGMRVEQVAPGRVVGFRAGDALPLGGE